MSSSNFFNVVEFLFPDLDSGPSFMSLSSLVLELWQFLFIKGFTRNLEIEMTPALILYVIRGLEPVRDR